MLFEINSPFLCIVLSKSATLYLTSNVFFGFWIDILGQIAFFGEPGDAVVGMGTRRRGRQQNLIVAIQGSVHNLLYGQSYPY